MKMKPKSCSCRMCKSGKHTKHGNSAIKYDERSYRHATKIAINKGEEVIQPAHMGNFYD